ncbi:MAG TPA: hypothetical protein VFX60_10680 [Micromonospora sp.]|nr:hypothetical protein [Micromonospora sp.]
MLGIGRSRTRGEIVKSELNESLDHLKRAAGHTATGIGETVGPRINAARGQISPTMARIRNAASHRWGSAMIAIGPLVAAVADRDRQSEPVARKARSQDMQNRMMMRGLRGMAGMPMMHGLRSMPGLRRMTNMRGKKSRSRKRFPQMAGVLIAGTAVGAIGAMIMRRRQRQWAEYDPGLVMGRQEEVEPMIRGASSGPMGAMPGSPGLDTSQDTAIIGAEKVGSTAEAAEEALRSAGGRGIPNR